MQVNFTTIRGLSIVCSVQLIQSPNQNLPFNLHPAALLF